MKKSHQILIENLVFAFAINMVSFFTTYYQRRSNGVHSSFDILFDTIFSILYTVFLIIVFHKNKSLFSEGSFALRNEPNKYHLIIKFILVLAVKITYDATVPYISRISMQWKYLGVDLYAILYWVVSYIIAVKNDNAIWKNSKRLITILTIILATVGLGLVFDLYLLEQCGALYQKYEESSPYLARACANLDFMNSIHALIVDTIILCLLIIFHSTKRPLKKDTKYKQPFEKCTKGQHGFRLFIRCDVMITILLLLFVVKMAMAPEDVLLVTKKEVIKSFNNEAAGAFNITIKRQAVHKGFKIQSEMDICYFTELVTLQKGEHSPEYFSFNGAEPDFIFTGLGEQSHRCVQYSIDQSKVYLYGYYAICLYEDGSPKIIRIDELNMCENNAVVTELCKDLLSNGNLFVFEYGCKYFLKYDADFIKPYIDRYVNGEFSKTEIEWLTNSFYRAEYITSIAKSLSK